MRAVAEHTADGSKPTPSAQPGGGERANKVVARPQQPTAGAGLAADPSSTNKQQSAVIIETPAKPSVAPRHQQRHESAQPAAQGNPVSLDCVNPEPRLVFRTVADDETKPLKRHISAAEHSSWPI